MSCCSTRASRHLNAPSVRSRTGGTGPSSASRRRGTPASTGSRTSSSSRAPSAHPDSDPDPNLYPKPDPDPYPGIHPVPLPRLTPDRRYQHRLVVTEGQELGRAMVLTGSRTDSVMQCMPLYGLYKYGGSRVLQAPDGAQGPHVQHQHLRPRRAQALLLPPADDHLLRHVGRPAQGCEFRSPPLCWQC